MTTPEPRPDGRDNNALARYAKALKLALSQANRDKLALRLWLMENNKPELISD
jgi:hypothetical protein